MDQRYADLTVEELQTFKAAFFKALAHPVRIAILERLVQGERTVQELQETLDLECPSCRNNSAC